MIKTILFCLFVAIIVWKLSICDCNEHMTDVTASESVVDLNKEAIQNIASVYNADNLKATNISSTNIINSNKGIKIEGGGITSGIDPTATSDLGLYQNTDGKWIRFVNKNGAFKFYSDGGIGTKQVAAIDKDGILSTGHLYIRGGVGSPNNWSSHFPYIENGVIKENYIRGNTIVDGNITFNNQSNFNGGCSFKGPISEVITIINVPEWTATSHNKAFTDSQIIKKTDPDGTSRTVIFKKDNTWGMYTFVKLGNIVKKYDYGAASNLVSDIALS